MVDSPIIVRVPWSGPKWMIRQPWLTSAPPAVVSEPIEKPPATGIKEFMKDGTYAISIDADGHLGSGELLLERLHVEGGSPHCTMTGEISRSGAHTIGALTLEWAPGVLSNARIGRVFAMSMSGIGTECDFRLWGLGPLGLIVELSGTRLQSGSTAVSPPTNAR